MAQVTYAFPPEWQGFGLAVFDVLKRRPVMILLEQVDADPSDDDSHYRLVGEVPFPLDSQGWIGAKPLTPMARAMKTLAKRRKNRKRK